MQQWSDKTRILAMTHLKQIMSSPDNQVQAASLGAVHTITMGLKKQWKNPIVLALGGEILAQLALNLAARQNFSFSMTVPILVSTLSHQVGDVRSGCSSALRSLSEFRDGVDVLLENTSMMASLVKVDSPTCGLDDLILVYIFTYFETLLISKIGARRC